MLTILPTYKKIFLAISPIGLILGFSFSLLFLNQHKEEAIVLAYEEIQPEIIEVQEEKMESAIVTAYSCIGLETEEEIKLNCPSKKYSPNGRTATGTEPRPYKTVACDRSNLGKTFYLEGIGEVKCEDTGGAIKGAGRFDLYVESVDAARKWGKQEILYKESK
jgi:3D (Asp-Asp-Asp) domain-containing protein